MVGFFVRKHSAVFCFSGMVIIAGLLAYFTLPRESVPEIKQPYIFITTTYAGVSAKDIENLVTRIIEEEIDGLEGLHELTSSSKQSISFIFAEFTSDVTQEVALRRIRERVDIAKSNLPDDADEPVVQEFSSSNWPVFITVLSHPKGLAVIDKAAENVEDVLKRVKGVLDVNVAGKLEKEVSIELDPKKLEHFEFSIDQVIGSIQSENITIPGGNFKNAAKNYSLSVTGEIEDHAIFEELVVKANGVKAKLGELGTVSFGWAEPQTYSRLNGKPCISFSITKRAGENIIDIVDDAKKLMNEINAELPPGTKVDFTYDESNTIRDLIADLENNVVTAFLLVFLVTVFFLGFRTSLFVSLAIPFSMLMSFSVLQFMGITLNMVVLFSLVLALGMLVDNGIVIVENIFRHAAMGKSRKQAAIEGSQEVAMPIIASTVTTCLAFFPIVFMPGVMGDFLAFLPKTVIIVLTSSLIVALTINPVFCASFLNVSEKNRKKVTEGSGYFVKFQNWYEKVVRWSVDHSIVIILMSFVIVFVGFFLYYTYGKGSEFFPSLDPKTGVISIEMSQGTPLDTTDKLVRSIEDIVPKSPASLESFIATTGRGSADNIFGGMGEEFHKANIRVEYKPFLEKIISGQVAIDSLRGRLKDFTGAKITVKELEDGPPTGTPISYQITGSDYVVLGAISDSILAILTDYEELKEVESDFESAKPEISVEIDRRMAVYYGLSTSQIASTIRNAMNGGTIGTFRQDKDEYDIVVRFQKQYRNTLNHLANLQIVNGDDERIPLNSVATIKQTSSVGVIQRRNLDRAVQISADYKSDVMNPKEIKHEIDSLINSITIPKGYYIGEGGGLEMRNEASQFLVKAFGIAVFLIFIVLIAQFNSFSQSIIIMVTVLLALGGIFWGYFITGQKFIVIMSGIGCIALVGVVVNNCIVLIDYTNLLIKRGLHWHDAIIEAGKTRLRPVLLTAITTVLGMLPMAIGITFDFHKFALQFGSDSGQMWIPFAWAMIYGLSFATAMTLVIVPAMLSVNFKIFPPKKESSD